MEVVDDFSIAQAWTAGISSRVDDLVNGTVQAIPGTQVFADIAAHNDA